LTSDNLNAIESATLVVLMVEGRDLLNTELVKDFSITLSPAGRAKLERLGYIEVDKTTKPMTLRLKDAGAVRCKEPFDFRSSGAKFNGVALTLLMTAVQRDLARTGRSLAMMFSPDPEPVAPAALLEQIRVAYKELAPQAGEWVNLADIRDALATVDRDDLDAALRQLEQHSDVNIVPQANEKALSERTRRAAVIIGRQHKHFIAIGV
jgi:hypothetical protein